MDISPALTRPPSAHFPANQKAFGGRSPVLPEVVVVSPVSVDLSRDPLRVHAPPISGSPPFSPPAYLFRCVFLVLKNSSGPCSVPSVSLLRPAPEDPFPIRPAPPLRVLDLLRPVLLLEFFINPFSLPGVTFRRLMRSFLCISAYLLVFAPLHFCKALLFIDSSSCFTLFHLSL